MLCDRPGCHTRTDTTKMQMRNQEGYRAIVCRCCKKQQRTQNWTCQCGCLWHQCTLHRIDPTTHQSRRTANDDRGAKRPPELLATNRPKPKVKAAIIKHTNRRHTGHRMCLELPVTGVTELAGAHAISKEHCPKLADKLALQFPQLFLP